jgi:hexokinase
MGKGFLADDGLVGEDLGEIIKLACYKKGLHVELSAIVNDSSATLLSEAYITPSTRFGLILGTGVNIAAHLPVTTIGLPKYGSRPSSWHDSASHVIVNTELGMFGKDILPLTKWDKLLKAAHPRPDFQPLEHLVSGYYLGEICRLALVDAIATTGIFSGSVPPSLQTPYSLDTETLSLIEAYASLSSFPHCNPALTEFDSDTTPNLSTALQTFTTRHPSPAPPSPADLSFLRTLSSLIARRSASLVGASVFALWELKAEAEREQLSSTKSSSAAVAELQLISDAKTTVAFNGSVIENYPGYRTHLQGYIDELVADAAAEGRGKEGSNSSSSSKGSIALVEARESSLLGAAVALACLS